MLTIKVWLTLDKKEVYWWDCNRLWQTGYGWFNLWNALSKSQIGSSHPTVIINVQSTNSDAMSLREEGKATREICQFHSTASFECEKQRNGFVTITIPAWSGSARLRSCGNKRRSHCMPVRCSSHRRHPSIIEDIRSEEARRRTSLRFTGDTGMWYTTYVAMFHGVVHPTQWLPS